MNARASLSYVLVEHPLPADSILLHLRALQASSRATTMLHEHQLIVQYAPRLEALTKLDGVFVFASEADAARFRAMLPLPLGDYEQIFPGQFYSHACPLVRAIGSLDLSAETLSADVLAIVAIGVTLMESKPNGDVPPT